MIVNTIDYGMNVDEALNTPRIAARGNEINYSIEFPRAAILGVFNASSTFIP